MPSWAGAGLTLDALQQQVKFCMYQLELTAPAAATAATAAAAAGDRMRLRAATELAADAHWTGRRIAMGALAMLATTDEAETLRIGRRHGRPSGRVCPL